jgi:hypothetical protein
MIVTGIPCCLLATEHKKRLDKISVSCEWYMFSLLPYDELCELNWVYVAFSELGLVEHIATHDKTDVAGVVNRGSGFVFNGDAYTVIDAKNGVLLSVDRHTL